MKGQKKENKETHFEIATIIMNPRASIGHAQLHTGLFLSISSLLQNKEMALEFKR